MFLKRYIEGVLWTAVIGLPYLAAVVGNDVHRREVGVRTFMLFAIAAIWLLVFALVLPLHFYRAWKRWPQVPNRESYAAWVGLETVTAAAIIAVLCYSALTR